MLASKSEDIRNLFIGLFIRLASKSEDIRNLFIGLFIRPARQRTAMSRRARQR